MYGRVAQDAQPKQLYKKKEKTYFYELLMASGDSYEKIIRFYFLMKYYKRVFSLRKYHKFMGKVLFNY